MPTGVPFGSEPPTAQELKAERRRERRKARRRAERAGGRELADLADDAVERALQLAPAVADAPTAAGSERVIDVALPSRDAAVYVVRRINEALAIGEWLDEIDVWIWEAGESARPPLSDHGAATGIEIRLEQARRLGSER